MADITLNNTNLYSDIAKHSIWFPEDQANKVPEVWKPWLLDRGSLTSALTEFSANHFSVNVLSETEKRPLPWEAEKLGLAVDNEARVREVELICQEQVMVFARSIIPLTMLELDSGTFNKMGNKPLGHLLFKDGRARNRKRSLSRYQHANGECVYGRTTPFEYQGGEILVSEFFVNPALISV